MNPERDHSLPPQTPTGGQLPLYQRHQPDLVHNRYNFRICRSLAYGVSGITAARLFAYLAEIDALFPLVAAGWGFLWLTTLPQVLNVASNLRRGKRWDDGIMAQRLMLRIAIALVCTAGLFMELHRVKG